MDTWTVMTTLITGVLLGFFLLAGVVLAFIRMDDNKKLCEKASVYAHHFGVSMAEAKKIVKTL